MHRVETRLKGDVWAHERMTGEGYISWIVARAWIGEVVNKYVQFDERMENKRKTSRTGRLRIRQG